jgi:hypothetical protein
MYNLIKIVSWVSENGRAVGWISDLWPRNKGWVTNPPHQQAMIQAIEGSSRSKINYTSSSVELYWLKYTFNSHVFQSQSYTWGTVSSLYKLIHRKLQQNRPSVMWFFQSALQCIYALAKKCSINTINTMWGLMAWTTCTLSQDLCTSSFAFTPSVSYNYTGSHGCSLPWSITQ